MLGNASPNPVGSQAFSSLEELLNVTGINSPDLGDAGSGSGGGVDSLQQLAREVESKQLGKCVAVCVCVCVCVCDNGMVGNLDNSYSIALHKLSLTCTFKPQLKVHILRDCLHKHCDSLHSQIFLQM